MSKVVAISGSVQSELPETMLERGRNENGGTTEDYRRLLSELKLRPPSQREFLRKLLRRALTTGAPADFPVASHAVPNPVSPS